MTVTRVFICPNGHRSPQTFQEAVASIRCWCGQVAQPEQFAGHRLRPTPVPPPRN